MNSTKTSDAANDQIARLVVEYDRALEHTDLLWRDLSAEEVTWRPHEESSAIGWHLGHQAAVAHFLVRNLTAAEVSPDPELDPIMDSATSERDRGNLPDLDRLAAYRAEVANRVRFRMEAIADGSVGAPAQLAVIASTLLVAVINHEYQHSKWIGEVRHGQFGHPLPSTPTSPLLSQLDGYVVVSAR